MSVCFYKILNPALDRVYIIQTKGEHLDSTPKHNKQNKRPQKMFKGSGHGIWPVFGI